MAELIISQFTCDEDKKLLFQEQYKTIYQTLHLMFMSPYAVQSETEFLKKLHTENTENPTSGLSLRDEFEVLQSIK